MEQPAPPLAAAPDRDAKQSPRRPGRYVPVIVPAAFFLFLFIYLLTAIDPTVIYSNNGFNNDLFVRYLHQKESGFAYLQVPDTYSGDGFILELTPGYFKELFSAPGGVTKLAVALCIDACRSRVAGALALTFLAWVLVALFSLYLKKCGGVDPFGFRFAPAMALLFFCHYYHLKALVWLVPIAAALAAAVVHALLSREKPLFTTLTVFPLFWLCWYLCGWAGPLFLVLVALLELTGRRDAARIAFSALFVAINGALLFFLEPRLTAPEDALSAVTLFGWPVPGLYLLVSLPLLTALLLVPAWKKMLRAPLPLRATVQALCVATIGVAVIAVTRHDPLLRDVRAVSRTVHLVEHQMWDAIRNEDYSPQYASFPGKPGPLQPYLTHVRNRALAQTGMLGSEMFVYPQETFSPEPLLLRNSIVGFGFPLWAAAAGLFMELGMVNYAEKTIGELMECMGPYPFLMYRRSLLHLAKHNTDAASVYLNRLSAIPGYRAKAKRFLKLLSDSTALAQIPVIAHLRACMDTVDYFFLSCDEEALLLRLLERNPRNRLAFDYLMAFYLQTGQTEKLVIRFDHAKELGYTALPRHWEEAVCVFMSREDRDTAQTLPKEQPMVSRATFSRFDQFMQRYFALEDDPSAAKKLAGTFGSTYYYFYSFESSSGAKR
ncbi:MAG: hypothetical protein JXA71_03405 [Chitinispirillaceae bacterium]|nr:hypothetical protein [Chitinispirillaceae bacterium]